jgi:NDP-sugar pyrophosphorylase family protein
MDIRAILLLGAPDSGTGTEKVSGIPIAYLDVLGLPVLTRVLQRLQHFGISKATLITEAPSDPISFAHAVSVDHDLSRVEASGDEFWDAAENTFNQYTAEGADLVVALRIGPYVEVDFEEMIQHHLDHRCVISMAVDAQGSSLDAFVLDPSGRFDARVLFQSHLQHLRKDCKPFQVNCYVNRLQTAADLRRLATDSLLGKSAIRAEGLEVKPGVFVGRGARIHRKARVVAPAFIGAAAKVHASALITRGSVLERHAEVDCGTVVENSTLLPFTRLGAGLDVMHSVLGFGRLTHLVRNVEVEITDSKLLDMVPISPLSRLAGSTAALFAFLPKQIYRGFLAASHRETAVESPECAEPGGSALGAPVLESPASGTENSEFPNLAVVRRYGEN